MAEPNKDATARADLLELAIEHFCTTERPMDEKLTLLSKAESYMNQVKNTATLGRQEFADYRAEET